MAKVPDYARYVIIGAGIHGLSTAMHLTLRLKAQGTTVGASGIRVSVELTQSSSQSLRACAPTQLRHGTHTNVVGPWREPSGSRGRNRPPAGTRCGFGRQDKTCLAAPHTTEPEGRVGDPQVDANHGTEAHANPAALPGTRRQADFLIEQRRDVVNVQFTFRSSVRGPRHNHTARPTRKVCAIHRVRNSARPSRRIRVLCPVCRRAH